MEFCPILLELGQKQWNFGVWPWSLTFDLKRISPKMNYLHLVVYIWIKYDQNLPRGSRDIVIKRFFTQISLTFDPRPWADFTQNLVSSTTPHGAHLGQVWSKSGHKLMRYCDNETFQAKFIDLWPLTLGRFHPKSNQFIYIS